MDPFGFQWHLTDQCNLRCRHCYQRDFTAAADQPLARLAEAADRIFGALPGRPIEVNLTGGEPLLFPDLLPLIEKLHAFPTLKACHLITNGTVADLSLFDALGRFPKLQYIKLSIEAGTEARNDAIRGTGSFEKAIGNIPALLERAGKPIVLMITLAAYNATAVGEVVRLARQVGASGVIFERFVPLGRGAAMAGQALSPRGWRAAVDAIADAAGIEAEPRSLLPYTAFWLSLEPGAADRLAGASCNLGDRSMALMPDGAVYPCRRLPVPVGNLFDTPMAELLTRLSQFDPERTRARLPGPNCGGCGVAGCAGCRAMALAATGDRYADDPACPLNDPD